MGALDGLVVLIKDIRAKIYSWPVIICGVDSNGNPVPFGASPASGGGGGGIPVTGQTVTAVPKNVGASASQVIPAGAKGWTVSCITGTITIACGANSASALPAGFSDGDTNTTAADITITTASASSAYVRWNV